MGTDIVSRQQGIKSGGAVAAIIPQDFVQVQDIAHSMAVSQMVPKSYLGGDVANIREKVAVAILHGMEIGLSPVQAVQSIAVINGQPSIWGDSMLAICMNHPSFEDIDEEVIRDEKGNLVKAVCTVTRKGRKKPTVREFTVQQAQTAGLWTKQGPWKQFPERMLQLRARAFALRDTFPDALRGLRMAEEMTADFVVGTDGSWEIAPGAAEAPPAKPKREDYQAEDVVDVEVEEEAEEKAAEESPEPEPESPEPEQQTEEEAPGLPMDEPPPHESAPDNDLDDEAGEPEGWQLYDDAGQDRGIVPTPQMYADEMSRILDECKTPEQRQALREHNVEILKTAYRAGRADPKMPVAEKDALVARFKAITDAWRT